MTTDDYAAAVPPAEQAPTDVRQQEAAGLEALVPRWLTVPEAAELQGVGLSEVRRQLQERHLVGVRRGPHRAVYVPAAFVTAQGPRPELRGTITVLADGGLGDVDILQWLFAPDPTLRVPGSPMDSLLAGHKTEVRRRAMELAL